MFLFCHLQRPEAKGIRDSLRVQQHRPSYDPAFTQTRTDLRGSARLQHLHAFQAKLNSGSLLVLRHFITS